MRVASRDWLRQGGGLVLGALPLAYALKLHYSHATAADLGWILRPTAVLVGLFTRHEFAEEAAGFVNTELCVVITPACAGVNFLIMGLLTLALGQLGARLSSRARVIYAVCLLPVAFVVTVFVNAARVVVIAHSGGEHRVLGVVLYLLALSLLHFGARRLLSTASVPSQPCAP